MNFKGLVVNLYVIYRFPNTSVIQFCDELSDLLEENIVSDHGVLLLTGDFNIIYGQSSESGHPSSLVIS